MTQRPEPPRSPADEQRTDALPRTPGTAAQWPHTAAAATGPGPATSPPQQPPPQDRDTTVLRRPAGPPAQSNVPGAGQAAAPPPPDTAVQTGARGPSHLPPYSGPTYPPPIPPWPGPDAGPPAEPPSAGPPPTPGRTTPEPAALPGPPPPGDTPPETAGRPGPRKITVTRVAAMRSKELTQRAARMFHGAVSADGADRSGLSHLTYAVMGNYAVDATLAVALANTLFFAAATAESTVKVLLYLLLTVAPFAVIAPLIGPLLDRLQRGRRWALAGSGVGRAALAITMAFHFDSWALYPCALGMLVLSKSFGVLKAALTPRVLPASITLVKTNSRLTVFGMIAGGAAGGIAAGVAALTNSAGALWFTAICCLGGAYLCIRIPAWVESTEGEIPITGSGALPRTRNTAADGRPDAGKANKIFRQSLALPRSVAAALWTGAMVRINTGFLSLFAAFVIKTQYDAGGEPGESGWQQLLLLGAIGGAAGIGGFIGNGLGARLPLRAPVTVAQVCVGSVIAALTVGFIFPGLVATGAVALVGSMASALAKVCLDSTIQQGLPEASRASAFGRSESILQLNWVFGGVIGLLIGGIWQPDGSLVFEFGFAVIGALLVIGLTQSILLRADHSMLAPVRRSLRGARNRPRNDTPTGQGRAG